MGIRQKKKLQKIWKHFGKSVICMLQLLFLRGRPKSHLCEWVPCETILIFILRKWLKIVKNTWRQFFKINERSFLKAWSLFCNLKKKKKSLWGGVCFVTEPYLSAVQIRLSYIHSRSEPYSFIVVSRKMENVYGKN